MKPSGRYFRAGGLGNLPDFSNAGPKAPIGIPPPAEIVAQMTGQSGRAISTDNQSYWQSLPFVVGTEPVKLQGFLLRKFLVLQNKDGANTLYFGFGWKPDANNGLVLGPGVGYEPFSYPVNEIWVSASAANTAGLMITGS